MLSRTPASNSGAPAGVDANSRVPMSDALNDAERTLVLAEIERIQRGIGLSGAEVSGYFDGATRRGIYAWQAKVGLTPANGELSETQIRQLLAFR